MAIMLLIWLRTRPYPDERGASMVEYALLLSLLVVVALIGVKTFGTAVSDQFDTIASKTK